MVTFLLSAINVILLLYLFYKCIKNRYDSAVLYYCLISLYFINFPLFYDSLMIISNGVNSWETTLMDVHKYWSNGTLKNIDSIARCSLVFNCCFLFTYYVVNRKALKENVLVYRDLSKTTLRTLSWKRCFLFSYVGLVMFMIYNQISSFSMMEVGEWYENRSGSHVLALLSSLLVPIMSVGVIRLCYSKDFIRGGLVILPVLVIGIFTGARSQIIPVVFYFLFYFLWANPRFRLRNILLSGGIVFLLIYLMTITREDVAALYPIYKDWAYVDLFYVFDNGTAISTRGLNTLTMIARDFMPVQVQDITTVVADSKFGAGWGTLHPSLLGWAYVDLLDYYWILAIFFGLFVAVYDRLRHYMSTLIYFLFMSYEFAFLAIAIRGSVKFAYSQLLYPFFILIFLFILDKTKLIKCHYIKQ